MERVDLGCRKDIVRIIEAFVWRLLTQASRHTIWTRPNLDWRGAKVCRRGHICAAICIGFLYCAGPLPITRSVGGLVVEFSPATRETRVRFPAVAISFPLLGSAQLLTDPCLAPSILPASEGSSFRPCTLTTVTQPYALTHAAPSSISSARPSHPRTRHTVTRHAPAAAPSLCAVCWYQWPVCQTGSKARSCLSDDWRLTFGRRVPA